jgi:hypothetical protein
MELVFVANVEVEQQRRDFDDDVEPVVAAVDNWRRRG